MATIYLVDDSRLHLKLLGGTLEERGYNLKCFELAPDLLKALDEEAPDLIVSDIVMPQMDGVELCAEIRKKYSKEELPILLVSSLDTMEDMVRGYEAGADDYLVKPIRAPEFHAKVSLLLRQRRAMSMTRKNKIDKATSESADGVESAEDALKPPPRLIDRYEVLGVLGAGAYGTVYRARRLGCEEIIALKVLSETKLNQSNIARFLRETEVLKTLGELDGIAPIIDVGYDGEHYFYAMDLIPGAAISKILAKDGPLSEYAGIRLANDIAQVLCALTECDIVHRDIKPANIIIGEDGKTTLIDFGLARLTEGVKVTRRHETPGTPAYMPPEVIRGRQVDIRGDMYSLGVTLFETLTTKLPYDGASSLYMLVKIAEGSPPNMDPLIEAEVSPGLTAIIERMIANTPEDRYQNPEELIADIAQYL
jgi:eukaryotic-like serine/threonine-protein kinase